MGRGSCGNMSPALVTEKGGEVRLGSRVDKLHVEDERVVSVEAVHANGERETIAADYVFSTMPMRDLIRSLDVPVPAEIQRDYGGPGLSRLHHSGSAGGQAGGERSRTDLC